MSRAVTLDMEYKRGTFAIVSKKDNACPFIIGIGHGVARIETAEGGPVNIAEVDPRVYNDFISLSLLAGLGPEDLLKNLPTVDGLFARIGSVYATL